MRIETRNTPSVRPSMHSAGRASMLAVALAALLLAAGCGTRVSAIRWARPQVVSLNWRENCGNSDDRILITTRRLIVRNQSWQVDLLRNATGVTLTIQRPHQLGGTLFGLEPFETASWREVLRRAQLNGAKPRTIADRFTPSKPALLRPGEGWSGSFAGPGRLPRGVPIRVVVGRFVIGGPVPNGLLAQFLCVSRRVVRLK